MKWSKNFGDRTEVVEIRRMEYVPDILNPRENDNLGIMFLYHKRYNLPNEFGVDHNKFSSWREIAEYISKNGGIYITDVYGYDHGHLIMSTLYKYPFNDRWDAGQLGFIFTTKEKMEKYGTNDSKKIKRILASEVEEYSNYINGEIYEYIHTESTLCPKCGCVSEKVIEACGGYSKKELEDLISDLKEKIMIEDGWREEEK